ncbi:putative efflux protein, MATE family [Peptoclostridium litorale DSM 5388]|uniref:MATE efflux family protein n=1 Tax=Peptoclostridium litorale DSM 5388 TaxID=1121324 RepID=A0A069RDK4_PEPLI|nr:MATE family efflux transporter [Peptoclostridium litorale]KDR95129.1 MATE efflux family protein [Peptoclostridium litorale DSM 5388]SIN74549.1 putative efflux protein, MATE family [Peptoclostridium litorale DSM 5388]
MNDAMLLEGDIKELIKRLSVPASTGFLFNTMFNVTDTLYAGMLSTDALAGLSLSFPAFFIIIAFTAGMGTGATAIISNEIGKMDIERVRKYIVNSISLSIILSGLLTIAGRLSIGAMFNLMGAQGRSLKEALGYMNVVLYGVVFFSLNAALNSILSAYGDTKPYRNFLIIGFFVNIILDPLFIFGIFGMPKMGTAGVALATVAVQALGSAYLLKRIVQKGIFDGIGIYEIKPSIFHYFQILQQGIPSALNMASIAAGMFVINYFIMEYSGAKTIAAYGISLRIEQIALLPTIGLNVAVLSIVGQNFGAQKYERIWSAYKTSMIYGVAIMTLAMAVVFPFAKSLVGFFSRDSQVIISGAQYLRIEVFTFNTYVLLNVSISALQGLKKPGFAVYIGLYRQLLMPVLIFPAFGEAMGFGVIGVWWGIFAVNWSAVFITIAYTMKIFSKKGII